MDEIKLNKTQKRVFDFLTEKGSITILDAITEFGETRLSSRIFELKEKGINIASKKIAVSNRFGEKRWVNKYFIAGAEK